MALLPVVGDGVRPATLAKDARTLKAAFNWARKRGYIAANPFEQVELPHSTRRERIVLTPEQCNVLLAAAEKEGPVFHAFVAVALEAGRRIG